MKEARIRVRQNTIPILVALLVIAITCAYFYVLHIPAAQSAPDAGPQAASVRDVGAPICTQISPDLFNDLLRERRKITHKPIVRSQIARKPVCLHRFNDLKRKIKRLRADCRYAADAVKCWIRAAAKRYGIDPAGALRVAYCESSFNPRTEYKGHYGLFQFLRSTFKTTPYGNRDIWSPKWNSLAAMWLVRHDGDWRQWACKP